MLKITIICAIIGHILCGVCDCLLGYSKKGRLNLKDVKDPEKMREMFADMPLSFPMTSIIIGTFSILLFSFGYFGLCYWMKDFSVLSANIMLIASLLFLIPIVAHHIICGFVEWFYIKLGRTDEVRTSVLDFQKKTISTMFAGYLGLLVFLVTLFVMVVSGKTSLPAWGCIFNTLVFMIPMIPTKIPAKGNVCGALMFIGLLIML